MKYKIASLIIFILVFCFGSFTFAAGKRVQAGCSNATLKGSYGIYRSGDTPDGPLASVGIVFYDGKGHLQSRFKTIVNGIHHSNVSSLEYSVAKDCTYKSFANGNEVASGVIVDNGNRIFLLSLTPGTTMFGVWEKIHQ